MSEGAGIYMSSELLVNHRNSANDQGSKSTGFCPLCPHYNSHSYQLLPTLTIHLLLLVVYLPRHLSPYTLRLSISTHS